MMHRPAKNCYDSVGTVIEVIAAAANTDDKFVCRCVHAIYGAAEKFDGEKHTHRECG